MSDEAISELFENNNYEIASFAKILKIVYQHRPETVTLGILDLQAI